MPLNSGSGVTHPRLPCTGKCPHDSAVTHRRVLWPPRPCTDTHRRSRVPPAPASGSTQPGPRPTLSRPGGPCPGGRPSASLAFRGSFPGFSPAQPTGVLNPSRPPAVRGPASTHVLGTTPLFLHGAGRKMGAGLGRARGGCRARVGARPRRQTYAAALVREVADAFLWADRQLHRNDPARLLKAKQVETEVAERKMYFRQRAMTQEGTSGLRHNLSNRVTRNARNATDPTPVCPASTAQLCSAQAV